MYRLKSLAFLSSLLQLSFVNGQMVPAVVTTTREAITRTVAVARGGHTFEPDVTQAEVGDYVEFEFYPKNHSVVRAPYKHPCIPFERLETDKVGFFSGFFPLDAILDDPPKWRIRINDTDPIFYYCSAPGSCITYAMIGVINPNATTSLEVQRNEAEKSTFMLQPGENWPDESSPPGAESHSSSYSRTSPTASPTASTTGAPVSATSAAAAAVAGHHGLSAGAIAGIAIGSALVLLMAAALVYLCGRNRALSDIIHPRRAQPHSGDFGGGVVQHAQADSKHMSGMTMMSSPGEFGAYNPHSAALPGYIGPHNMVQSSPQMPYAPSDALSPATPNVRCSSPGSSVVPAYTTSPPLASPAPVGHDVDGPHEMEGGWFHRKNSTRKGGTERYG